MAVQAIAALRDLFLAILQALQDRNAQDTMKAKQHRVSGSQRDADLKVLHCDL